MTENRVDRNCTRARQMYFTTDHITTLRYIFKPFFFFFFHLYERDFDRYGCTIARDRETRNEYDRLIVSRNTLIEESNGGVWAGLGGGRVRQSTVFSGQGDHR